MSGRMSLRSSVCISSLCAFGLGLAFEQEAAAQQGFAINRFDPAEQAGVFFRGDSLDIAGDRRWAAGVIGDWGHKVLVARDENGVELATPIRDQFFLHLAGSLVLVERLRVGLDIPILAYQNAEHFDAPRVSLAPSEDVALGDIRLGADYRLLGEAEQPLRLAAGVRVYLPSGNRDAFASDGRARMAPAVSAAGELDQFVYAASMGFMIRRGHDFKREQVGSEVFLSLAGGARLLDNRLVIGPELFLTTDIADGSAGFFSAKTTPVEVILGCHYDVVQDVRLGFGFGPGLTEGLGEPESRWLASVQWAPGVEPKPEPPPPDRDGDGIIDAQDRCPDRAGVPQSDAALNGCPLPPKPADADADGIPDDLDACPTLAGPENVEDPKQNGCPPPPDQDGDGIADDADACPTEAGVAKPDDPAKNGCPAPVDVDGDGITDDKDACPKDSGLPNEDPTKNGCPLAIVRESRIQILDRIEFETNKAVLTAASDRVLEAVAKVLQEHPEITKVSIEGHTDDQGPAWLNRRLSKNRAAAVLDWLVKRGIATARLTSAGFGPDRPLEKNDTEAGRQTNRRVEFQIVELNGKPNPASNEGR